MSYLIWKLVHVLGVIAFLGNIVTGVFWAAHARRGGDAALVAATFDGIIRSDRWFTIPGVIVITVSGIAAAVRGGFPILGTGWILWGLVLFIISGVVFMARVGPLQDRLHRIAVAGTPDWAAFDREYRRWLHWGLVATLAPLGATALMILKPALPAL